jgi:hypothetical protein
LPDQGIFPEEKIFAEAAIASFLGKHTQLRVPAISHQGTDPDLGPFMVIEKFKSLRDMSDALQTPNTDPDDPPVLDPNILESKLKNLYLKMAQCMLQLVQPVFPRIGNLVELGSEGYDVIERPITMNMTTMVQISNIPSSILPPKGITYDTADGWYTALAEMQIATLIFQHNDIISSEDDCRTKYVARQVFHRLAREGQLSKFGFVDDNWSANHARGTLPAPDNSGSFRLWSDDFRPVNVLIEDNDDIIGAIDWEFAYAAPTQFALDPPWWLLLETPEMWDDGIEDWVDIYNRRLSTWLSAIEEAEKDLRPGPLLLSAYMRESWETGRFWLNYGARKCWAFDTVYWKYLDERFFGKRDGDIPMEELWKTRVHLLTENERAAMEQLVQIKIKESKERVLVDWDAKEAKDRLSSFLFD